MDSMAGLVRTLLVVCLDAWHKTHYDSFLVPPVLCTQLSFSVRQQQRELEAHKYKHIMNSVLLHHHMPDQLTVSWRAM